MLTKISDSCFYIKGHVNIGYITKNEEGLLIDCGLDKGAAKKIIKILKEHNLPLNYCIITHGHVDHYGGAAQLQKELEIELYSTKLESSFVTNPILEPIYLWNGAMPIKELRNKFLEGEAASIAGFLHEGIQKIGPFLFEVLPFPGHSYGQIGVLIDEILFAADSYFGIDVLKKHKVPFIVDAKETLETLKKILNYSFQGALPGHGDYETDIRETIYANIECHENILKFLSSSFQGQENGISMEDLQSLFFNQFELYPANIGSWLLYRTSFTAYISTLIERGNITISINENKLWLQCS
ncbi:MBL fold metallo-hydrolase [Lederbergia wuyishanensis]|uniref:Glyoxylase-like metal-dependent hydrolase (Beta-lactamase superfamily II) n=1 Tax=Lederbergia wuyishanensis TaxID=1347903 RepID=A0ABU0CZ22_9BACI|nr:MBL fold metallo-hydrolase [Lederbergia wuyishanensis]MCJ8006024.1 MBL fold metallo-hydrolase [Lederbergia wuyishanensis]MDQ0341391.1 glyoxylase-like metal-dependent hydrolase (beta-lactamase superfamily II) [Lederbergia wuyishanensis]